ncbi:MAG: hypothetical protein Q7V58_10025 [Actinomycetota bacterium]|nr:hypothetical protein [Actinomycetota bacterium]
MTSETKPDPDDVVDNETTLAELNDNPPSTDETDAADGERVDNETVLARVNDNPPPDREERP